MKNLMLVTVLLVSGNLFAKSSKSEKIDFIKCLRKNVNSRRLDVSILNEYANLLKSYDGTNAVELTDTCLYLREQNRDVKKISFSEAADKLYDLKLNARGLDGIRPYWMLENFVVNQSTCTFHKVRADIVVGLGVGAGIGVGTCKQSNGRRWIALIPDGALHVGAGVFVTAVKNTVTFSNISNSDEQGIINAGIIIARTSNLDEEGPGIGLGFSMGSRYDLRLKTIPLKSNYKVLIKQLDEMIPSQK